VLGGVALPDERHGCDELGESVHVVAVGLLVLAGVPSLEELGAADPSSRRAMPSKTSPAACSLI